MSPKVVPLRDAPSLMDIAGRLRWHADRLDACETQDVRTLLLVCETTDGKVSTSCYGVNPSRTEVVGLLTRAAHGHMGTPE